MTDDIDSNYRLYRGDARELKNTLEKQFEESTNLIDAIITSPPYGNLVEYGDEQEQVGQQSYEEFLEDLRDIFRQCYELATQNCTLWIISDTFRVGNRVVRLPFDLADELENLYERSECSASRCRGKLRRDRGTGEWICEACGRTVDCLAESWRMEDSIIWDKQRTRPWNQKGQFRNVHEYLTMFSKTDDFTFNKDAVRIRDTDEFQGWWVNYPERYDPKGIFPSNIWRYPIPKQGEWGPGVSYHPSPFPRGLVERIVKVASTPGDVIFDPFAGVGTTLAVAEALNRKPLGFELNQEYISYYQNHVRPKTIHDFGTTQTKLRESTSDLEEIIFTLRIHKFAFKLYSQLVDQEGFQDQMTNVAFIDVTSDSEQFRGQKKPFVEFKFVTFPEGKGIGGEIHADVSDKLFERQTSGDYYGIDFELILIDYPTYCEDVMTGGKPGTPDVVHIYEGGIHNVVQETVTLDEWAIILRNKSWDRFVSKEWPPLVSTLGVDIKDPMKQTTTIKNNDQTGLDRF